jgi:hypothetical protein
MTAVPEDTNWMAYGTNGDPHHVPESVQLPATSSQTQYIKKGSFSSESSPEKTIYPSTWNSS